MKRRVIIDLSASKDGELDGDVLRIGFKMDGNPHFPMLTDYITAVVTTGQAYHTAYMAAKDGGKEAHRNKDAARAAVLQAVRVLGVRINEVANGDLVLLESTGYPLAKVNVPHRKSKDAVELTPGSHSLTVTLNDNPDGAPHFVQYTTWPVTESSQWTTVYMTEDELVIPNLAPDHKYAVRIAEIVHGAQEPVYGAPIVSKYVE